MTKKEAIKQFNAIEPGNFKSVDEYLCAREDYFVENYHFLHNLQYAHLSSLGQIAKVNTLIEIIKHPNTCPSQVFLSAVLLHKIHKSLRKRYGSKMSVDNIRIMQLLES